jgi:2,3,4,5-tetrahydropyridine-2-carboxylate N-succinyltransferase
MTINTSARHHDVLKPLIEEIFEKAVKQPGAELTAKDMDVVHETLGLIDRGHARVAEPGIGGTWVTNVWLKQAILLYFKITESEQIPCPPFEWRDKIPPKKWNDTMGVRAVPMSFVRYGAYVGKNAILMPCFVNIGAYVDTGTMVDTWATVGSCAQIGKNVHLSGGVGIGGVLEPAQAQPVIIEDGCFIGSRVIVVEGVHVKKGAVLGAGVVLTKSTPIVDVTGPQPVVTKGTVPENAVVIPGSIPKKFPAGNFNTPCAMIIGKRSASTDAKTSLNEVLRDMEVPV